MAEMRRLVAIRAEGPDHYVATLATEHGDEKDYDFTVNRGKITVIEESIEFGEDIGPFGYSHLVPRAVAAFRDSHEKPVGRPDGYESHPAKRTSDATNEPQTGDGP